MANPFAILWKSIVDVYGELFPMVGMNLLWLLISIPIILVLYVLLALVAGLDPSYALVGAILIAMLYPNPARMGIHRFAFNIVSDELVEFDLFWMGLRQYWKSALLYLGIGVVVTAILLVNIAFYFSSPVLPTPVRFLVFLWIYALLIWIAMQLFIGPLLVEQTEQRVLTTLRNAFILALGNAISVLVLTILLIVIAVVSIGIALLLALVTGALIAVAETRAVHVYLERYRPESSSPERDRLPPDR